MLGIENDRLTASIKNTINSGFNDTAVIGYRREIITHLRKHVILDFHYALYTSPNKNGLSVGKNVQNCV